MKAKEYFEKYFENVKTFEEIEENSKAMFTDMLKEYNELKNARKVKTVDGIVGVVREINTKWNSVATKVEHKFSTPVIKRNVIWNELLSNVDQVGHTFPRKPD